MNKILISMIISGFAVNSFAGENTSAAAQVSTATTTKSRSIKIVGIISDQNCSPVRSFTSTFVACHRLLYHPLYPLEKQKEKYLCRR